MEKKIRFNLMDCLIVVAIVAAIAGILLFFAGSDPKAEKEYINVTYQVQLTECDKGVVDQFTAAKESGAEFLVGTSDAVKAEVLEMKVEAARRHATDMLNGEATLKEVPDHYDITFTLKSPGMETDEEIYAGEVASIRVGDGRLVRSKGIAGYGYVLSLDMEDMTDEEEKAYLEEQAKKKNKNKN